MAKYLLILIVLILALGGGFLFMQKGQSAPVEEQKTSACKEAIGEATVIMKDDGFDPQTISVKKCTKVIFKNEGTVAHWPASNLHPTHGIYPEFDPLEPVEPGKEWSFVFDKVGKWKDHDHLSPSIRGVIEVIE